jgi:hypothetical protein
MMPRPGSLAVLIAKRTLSPGSPLFANGVQVQAATQTYTGKRVVADENSVTGTLFNSTAQNPSEAYRWNQSTHCWTQLSARATHDDLIRIGAKSLANNPMHPNILHPAVETSLLNKASNSAIYRSADGASEYRLHGHRFVEHLGHSGSHCLVGADFEQYEVFYAGCFGHYTHKHSIELFQISIQRRMPCHKKLTQNVYAGATF